MVTMQIPPTHSSSHMCKTLKMSCYSTYLIMFNGYIQVSVNHFLKTDLLSLDSMTSCETNCITLVRKLYLWNYVVFVAQARDGKLDKTNSCSTITSSVHVPMSSTKPESSHEIQRVSLYLDKLHWAIISKMCCDHVSEQCVRVSKIVYHRLTLQCRPQVSFQSSQLKLNLHNCRLDCSLWDFCCWMLEVGGTASFVPLHIN